MQPFHDVMIENFDKNRAHVFETYGEEVNKKGFQVNLSLVNFGDINMKVSLFEVYARLQLWCMRSFVLLEQRRSKLMDKEVVFGSLCYIILKY